MIADPILLADPVLRAAATAVSAAPPLTEVARVIATIGTWLGIAALVFGLLKLIHLPLAVAFEALEARKRSRGIITFADANPLVSVIIPAYNEGVVLANCVRSVLASDHRRLEVIIVNDGSTDDTAEVMAELAALDPRVRAVSQANAGKGAALNHGIRLSQGSLLMFVDADGVFRADTISQLLLGFDHPRVGAVCGDDRPVNLDRPLTQMLAVFSHAGCGLVRRALSVLGVLHIVSGNIGAFPRWVVEEVGGFDEHTLGEDLELTWRVRRAGYSVRFRPSAIVHAESPSTVRALWRQRVRWSRGLLQTMATHRDMIGSTRFGGFGPFLVYNTVNMIVMPIVHLVVMACIPFMFLAGQPPFGMSLVSILVWLGLGVSVAVIVFAMWMNRALDDIRLLWTIPMWPFLTTMLAAVVVEALWREATGSEQRWNKLERTGVVTDAALREAAGLDRERVPA